MINDQLHGYLTTFTTIYHVVVELLYCMVYSIQDTHFQVVFVYVEWAFILFISQGEHGSLIRHKAGAFRAELN